MDKASATAPVPVRRIWPEAWRLPGRRQVLIGLGLGGGLAGFTLGWPWIAAAGLAPFVLSVLLCAAMCALGLCAMRGGQKSCHGESESARNGNAEKAIQGPSQAPATEQPRPKIPS